MCVCVCVCARARARAGMHTEYFLSGGEIDGVGVCVEIIANYNYCL